MSSPPALTVLHCGGHPFRMPFHIHIHPIGDSLDTLLPLGAHHLYVTNTFSYYKTKRNFSTNDHGHWARTRHVREKATKSRACEALANAHESPHSQCTHETKTNQESLFIIIQHRCKGERHEFVSITAGRARVRRARLRGCLQLHAVDRAMGLAATPSQNGVRCVDSGRLCDFK